MEIRFFSNHSALGRSYREQQKKQERDGEENGVSDKERGSPYQGPTDQGYPPLAPYRGRARFPQFAPYQFQGDPLGSATISKNAFNWATIHEKQQTTPAYLFFQLQKLHAFNCT